MGCSLMGLTGSSVGFAIILKKDKRRFVTRSVRTRLLLNNIISIRPELPPMHFFVSYIAKYWFSAQNSSIKEQLVVSLVNSEQFYSLISRLVEINQWPLNCNPVWFWHSLTTQSCSVWSWATPRSRQEKSFSSAYFFGEITSNCRLSELSRQPDLPGLWHLAWHSAMLLKLLALPKQPP